jgi:PAS domain S-box-containing protein
MNSVSISLIVIILVLAAIWMVTYSRQRRHAEAVQSELKTTLRRLQDNLDAQKANEERLSRVNAISASLFSSLEYEGLFQKASHVIAEALSAEIVLVFKMSDDKQFLRLAAHEGISEKFAATIWSIGVGEGTYGGVARTAAPVIVTDAASDPRLNTEEFRQMRIVCQMVIPLMLKGNVGGVIVIATRRPQLYANYDLALLTTIANLIAIALENATLFENERATARQLTESEGSYRRLLEHASDAIWAQDMEGRIVSANRAAAEMAGYKSVEELIGRDVREFLGQEGISIARKIRAHLLEVGRLENPYEQHLVKKDGSEIILMISSSLITHEKLPPVFEHVARDVTRERHMQDNLRYYVQQITRSQEEERNRIARELHDDTAQALYALNRQVDNYLRNSGTSLAPETRAFLEKMGEQIRACLQGVRRFSQDLRPPMLDDLGLLATLRWLIRDLQQRCNLETNLVVTGSERRLPAYIELTVFRVIQEAARNVEKHAQATKMTIKIDYADKIRISITDNGKGFQLNGDLADLPREGRLGLVGMAERVRLIAGTFNIQSELGKGTTVTLEVPILSRE